MYVANRGSEWKYVNLTVAYFRFQVISPLRLPPPTMGDKFTSMVQNYEVDRQKVLFCRLVYKCESYHLGFFQEEYVC
jgi:hypothetical protein